jgi:hypothetical protein
MDATTIQGEASLMRPSEWFLLSFFMEALCSRLHGFLCVFEVNKLCWHLDVACYLSHSNQLQKKATQELKQSQLDAQLINGSRGHSLPLIQKMLTLMAVIFNN